MKFNVTREADTSSDSDTIFSYYGSGQLKGKWDTSISTVSIILTDADGKPFTDHYYDNPYIYSSADDVDSTGVYWGKDIYVEDTIRYGINVTETYTACTAGEWTMTVDKA